jgi:hypothetical protein
VCVYGKILTDPPEREKKTRLQSKARSRSPAAAEEEEQEEAMASGWGINGNKGRCYDFWLDFSSCMSRCRQPSDCVLLREDYLECLHHSKEVYPSPPFPPIFIPPCDSLPSRMDREIYPLLV